MYIRVWVAFRSATYSCSGGVRCSGCQELTLGSTAVLGPWMGCKNCMHVSLGCKPPFDCPSVVFA